MDRIQWGRVLLVSLAAAFLVLVIRGCAIANRNDVSQPDTEAPPTLLEGGSSVRVYDHRAEECLSLPLETYLVGVVAAEMPASFQLEALKAQAVAARTYTLYTLASGGCGAHDADICTSSACCHAYADEARRKRSWGVSYDENEGKIEQAVAETAGQVLLYDGKPIDALYHSSSGGSTENSEDVYSEALPYLRAVESSSEVGSARMTGSVAFSRAAFIERINARFPEAKLNASKLDKQLEILSATGSGRVRSMRLGGAVVTGKEVRQALGLDSTLFVYTLEKREIRFDTRGFGHGVGMSQTGANSMALGGRSYADILLYYYTDVELALMEA